MTLSQMSFSIPALMAPQFVGIRRLFCLILNENTKLLKRIYTVKIEAT